MPEAERASLGEALQGQSAVEVRFTVMADMARRWAAGDPASLDAYLDRWPGLKSDEATYLRLLDYEEVLAAAFGRAAPAVHADSLSARMRQLWASNASGPAPGPQGDGATETPIESESERVLGPVGPGDYLPVVPGFEVRSVLGRGGMGVVYLARQAQPRRLVALKMIRDDIGATPGELERMRVEAEAMAKVQHPNVVQVHAFDVLHGRPLLVLEYLPRGGLDNAWGGRPQDGRAAAELARKLALAVAAAHAAGVVHCDLKPANVLLTEAGEPKVSDFGLAKFGDALALRTGDVVGTPAYMSPEQAAGQVREVGPASDLYALGVVLYEALAGRPPFIGSKAQVFHQVLNTDPVPLRQLVPQVGRDLETICHKCLAKDPRRRYETADALANDLANYLEGKPIDARPVSRPERAAKWARRNKALAALVGLTAAVAVVGTPTFGWLWRSAENSRKQAEIDRTAKGNALDRETAARGQAEVDADQARQVTELLTGIFQASDPLAVFGFGPGLAGGRRTQTVTASELLEAAAERYRDARLDAHPLVRARLLGSIGSSFRSIGQFDRARPLLLTARDILRANAPEDKIELARGEFDLGLLELDRGDFLKAEECLRAAADLQERAGAGEAVVTNTRMYLGWTLAMLGLPEAEPLVRDVAAAWERLDGPTHPRTVVARFGLAALLIDQGRTAEAVAIAQGLIPLLAAQPNEQAKAIGQMMLTFQQAYPAAEGAKHLNPGFAKTLAMKLAVTSYRKCLAHAQQAFPPEHIYLCVIRYSIAATLDAAGDAAAAAEYKATYEAIVRAGSLAHPRAQNLVDDYGGYLARQGQVAEGRRLHEDAFTALSGRFGPNSPLLVKTILGRALFEARWGTPAETARYGEQALTLFKSAARARTRPVAVGLFDLAKQSRWAEHRDLATRLFSEARTLSDELDGPRSSNSCVARIVEADFHLGCGRPQAADDLLGEAESAVSADPSLIAPLEQRLRHRIRGLLESYRGRFGEAEVAMRAAVSIARTLDPAERPTVAEDMDILAGILADQHRYQDAIQLLAGPDRQKLGGCDNLQFIQRLTALRLAAGDSDGYARGMQEASQRTAGSTDASELATVAIAGGLSSDIVGWSPAQLACRLTQATANRQQYQWWSRGLAYAHLRANEPFEAEASIGRITEPRLPIDFALLAISSARMKDFQRAEERSKSLREAMRNGKPNEIQPYSYMGYHWLDRLQTTLLEKELTTCLGDKMQR